MAIELGTFTEIVDNMVGDVLNQLPDLDPTVDGSAIKAIVQSLAARSFESRQLIGQLITQMFPQTATGIFLELWAEYEGLTRNPATIATGILVAIGTAGSVIPIGTLLNSSSNVILQTQESETVNDTTTAITSITKSGSLVTVVCTTEHLLATGVDATLAGVTPAGYNGLHNMTVVDDFIFTYNETAALASPATVPGTVTYTGARLDVHTQATGQDQNIGSGVQASFSANIAGVDNTAFVKNPGIAGGTDIETDEALRVRVMESRAAILALFNADFLIQLAKTVSGVTRVFVEEITPGPGDTQVYFMRDGDTNPIPSSIDIENVNVVLQAFRPSNMKEADFKVLAPVPVPVNITLSALDPNTDTMKDNIRQVLKEFFTFGVDFKDNVLKARIESALYNSKDIESGQFLKSFTMSVPSADVTVGAGKIGTLGTITFS